MVFLKQTILLQIIKAIFHKYYRVSSWIFSPTCNRSIVININYQKVPENSADFLLRSFKYRSCHRRCSVRKGVLRNFAKFAGKHLCRVFFFIKLQASACNFIKKETLAQVLSSQFSKVSKNTFFTEQPWATASMSIFFDGAILLPVRKI